jgi:hypothetical protein
MLSWSDLQSSTRTVSTLFGARTVERDLPRNMREMGDLTELAYSYPHIRQQRKVRCRQRKKTLAHRVVSFSYLTRCVPLA